MALETTARWTNDMQFVGVSGSGHAVVMDARPQHGGTNTGPIPMEMLLTALAGCTGMDVVSLLKKMRVAFTRLEIKARGETREEHPRIFTRIDLEYTVYGKDIDESAVKRAIDLSQEKYCPITEILRPTCSINYKYQIVSQ